MKKLNSKSIWLTESCGNVGDLYATLKSIKVGDHMQAVIYYDSGIKLIDESFENYIKEGYVSEIFFHDKAIVFYLNKYKYKWVDDQALFIIRRSDIINIKEYENSNIEVVKFEKVKHMAKAAGRRGFGLVGSLIGLLGDNIETKENTTFEPGVMFEIEYYDNDKNISKLKYYCTKTAYPEIGQFLLTFIQKDIPEQLKVPINP